MSEEKSCKQCQAKFVVTSDDLAFYKKISPTFAGRTFEVPAPTLCPECRLQRRLARRNERALYKDRCGLCGKDIVTTFAKSSAIKSCCNSCWYGDGWDPLAYGADYDEKRPFFEQFSAVYKATPQLCLQNDNGITSQNCEYCQDLAYGKDCYLTSGSWHVENVMYCHEIYRSKDLIDCDYLTDSQGSYDCINSKNLHNCAFVEDSENCHECYFGYGLTGCSNCIECHALKNKSYYYRNRKITKEDFYKKKSKMLKTHQDIKLARESFEKWSSALPRKFANISGCEDSVGNNLRNCKGCFAFNTHNGQHCRYCNSCDSPVVCGDMFQSGKPELCFEGLTSDESYMALFTAWCWKCRNVLYSDNCMSLNNCFGCTGLQYKKYCILNKQYTEEEYNALVPKIIKKMIADGEWGEFFPTSISPFGYNETVAQDYFPLSKKEALERGLRWQDKPTGAFSGHPYKPKAVIDEYIIDKDECAKLLGGVVGCQATGKPFKVMPRELAFYIERKIPIPLDCPGYRSDMRFKRRNRIRLYQSGCANNGCNNRFVTVYAPEEKKRVYCESCYQKSTI